MIKRHLFTYLLSLLVTGVASSPVIAQQINFTSLTTKNGLSGNTVHAILKDRYNIMWIATNDGLNRFDGLKFTVYKHNPKDRHSLQSNEVISLFEDKDGRLWVGTRGEALSYFDRKTNSFIRLDADLRRPNAVNNTVNAICADQAGNIWAGTFLGLDKIDHHTHKNTWHFAKQGTPGYLQSENILSLFYDSKHRLWIGTDAGLHLYKPGTNSFIHFANDPSRPNSLPNNAVKAIAEDQRGNIWIGTRGGLSMLLPDNSGFKNYLHDPRDPQSISNSIIYAIAADKEKLWIGTEDGLNILDINTNKFATLTPDIRNPLSLSNKSIQSIYIDHKGIYWVGTFRTGIERYDTNRTMFNLRQSDVFDPDGLNMPVVTSFAEFTPDKIFIGTDGGGVSLFNKQTGLFKHVNITSKSFTATKGLAVLTLEMTKNKLLWMGTYQDGVFVYNPQTGAYKHYQQGPAPADLSQNDIFCIKEDTKGNIWIGTNGKGINVFNPSTGTFSKYLPDKRGGLPTNGYIRSIQEDKNGRIWIASYGSGIAVLDPSTQRFLHYDKAHNDLPNDIVNSVFIDHLGRTWAGTGGGGLAMFNSQTNKFITYYEQQGLADDYIYKILEDDKGCIWVSTNKGLSRFDPQTRLFRNFTRFNGLQNNEFVFGSGLKLSTGEIFFGGLEGFNYLNPKEVKLNQYAPEVLLTDLAVGNKPVAASPKGPISTDIAVARAINLDYKQNFAISYTGLNYSIPQQNQYAYKLDGFDRDWNYVGNGHTAYYTNVDPGEYTFRVKASNNDGVWNNQGTTIKVIIHPPFYRTIYAYVAYALAFIGLMFYLRAKGIQRVRKKFREEQEKIDARRAIEQERKEAERLHQLDLLKIKFLTNLSHEFRTPISLILSPAERLLEDKRDSNATTQLSIIKRNARRLLNLVNQLLDFRKMEEQELQLNATGGDIIKIVKEVYDSFWDLAERKQISFSFQSDKDHFYTSFDHNKVERILFNLISNAFKFTHENGEINVVVQTSTGETTITVQDTGIGIPADKKDKIFDNFYQVETAASILNQGTGIGLSITKEFVLMHRGTINVESTPGVGTSFTVNLPLEAAATTDAIAMPSAAEPEYAGLEAEEDKTQQQGNLPLVLLVEDNDDFRLHLSESLKPYYRIIEAANGKEGWQKALSGHPELVVSDISMPYMTGTELCEKIKTDKRTCHIPVILLTALSQEEDQIKGISIGANDYLTKPFNLEILKAKIKNLLEQNRSLKATFSKQIKIAPREIDFESGNEKFMNKVMLYIDKNLDNNKLSVEDLSKHLGMSRASLYNKILEITGLAPVEFIRSAKLDKAAVLIEKSDLNVTQIAYMTGFASPNYFAKSFKTKFNILPSEYLLLKRKETARKAEIAVTDETPD